MDNAYGARAVMEAIGWMVPATLAALAAIFKRPRQWLAGIPGRLRRAHAARSADRRLRLAMARDWPRFSADMTTAVAELRDSTSRASRKMHAIRDDVVEQVNGVRQVLGTLLAITLSDFENSPDPRFICGADGRITHVNAKLAAVLGVDRDELMGFRWHGRVPADKLAGFMTRFMAANAGHYQLDDEITFRNRDRQPLRFRILLLPFPPDDGPATHWAATLTPLERAA